MNIARYIQTLAVAASILMDCLPAFFQSQAPEASRAPARSERRAIVDGRPETPDYDNCTKAVDHGRYYNKPEGSMSRPSGS
jgi:hypothetical protein